MDNIAMHAATPQALPYFSYPATGQNVIQRTLGPGTYNLSWDLITSAGALFDRYLVDRQFAQLSASSQNGETWTTTTTTDPDKLQLMKFAYDKAFGTTDEIQENVLRAFLYEKDAADNLHHVGKVESAPITPTPYLAIQGKTGFPLNYYNKVYPGWFVIGRKHDIPKEACYVGHCGKTYAWVMPEHMNDLANFTLAILDIATYQSSRTPAPGTGSYGILPSPPAP
jgi:hypothetical protein